MNVISIAMKRTRAVGSTILMGLSIAGVGVAQSDGGFNADTVRAFLQKEVVTPEKEERPKYVVDDIQMILLSQDIDRFRRAAIIESTVDAMANLPEVMPGTLKAFQEGDISTTYPYIWPYVLAGSSVMVGNSLGDDPVVAFYNPYFDVAILSRWQFQDDEESPKGVGFKMVEAVPVSGNAFRENRPTGKTDEPAWADSTAELFEVRIVEATQKFLISFEKRYPPFSDKSVNLPAVNPSTAIKLIEDRVFFLLRWVKDAQDPSASVNYAKEIDEIRKSLSAPTQGRLADLLPEDNPQDASAFFRLGREIRSGLKPYLVINRNVIFIDPINLPTGFVSVYFEPTPGKGHSLALMTLYNLEARYPLR